MPLPIFPNRLPDVLHNAIAGYIDTYYKDTELEKLCYIRAMRQKCKTLSLNECAAPPMAQPTSLETMLKQADAGFSETLLKHIDQTGKKDSEIYKKAHISKQHFSKIRNNPHYQPTKPTAIALALALELNLEETGDLIGRAGYTLTNSSKADLIVRYFIEHREYDITQINIALYEFDQPLLGN